MLIAQLSDLHIVDRSSGEEAERQATSALRAAVARVNAFSPVPDLVLLTGDLTNNGTPGEYRILSELLGELEVPHLMVAGNHDEREALIAEFGGEAALPVEEGPIRYTRDLEGLRIVVVDTTVPGRHDGALGAEDLAWLDTTLAAEPSTPTLVAMHHPPFVTGIWWMDQAGLIEGMEAFAEVVSAHPQVVRIVSGHVHRAITGRVAGVEASVCPSIGRQVHLDLVAESAPAFTHEAPALQLHRWDGTGFVTHTTQVELPGGLIRPDYGDPEKVMERLRRRAPVHKPPPPGA